MTMTLQRSTRSIRRARPPKSARRRRHTKTADDEFDVMGDAWPCDVPNRLAEPFTPENNGAEPIATKVSSSRPILSQTKSDVG